jgi:hypothetical protein
VAGQTGKPADHPALLAHRLLLEGQDVAAGRFMAGGFWQREVRLDPVAAAAAIFLLNDVPGYGQVGDEAAAVGDA